MAVARIAPQPPRAIPYRRLAALAVLAVMAALYVSPAQRYLGANRQVTDQRSQLAALQRQHDRLVQEVAALQTPQQIQLLARECGWIMPGEHPLVVMDIPSRPGAQCH